MGWNDEEMSGTNERETDSSKMNKAERASFTARLHDDIDKWLAKGNTITLLPVGQCSTGNLLNPNRHRKPARVTS